MLKQSRTKKVTGIDASITDYLVKQGINPVQEWIDSLKPIYRFIVEIDYKRPEVRSLVSHKNFECIPIDDSKLCEECREVTKGGKASVCRHCGSSKVHPFVEVRRSGNITSAGWALMTEFAYPKLRSSEVTGTVSHQIVVNLAHPTLKETTETTSNVIDLDPDRNVIGNESNIRR